MPSLRNLLLYVTIGVSFLQVSTAAPVAGCTTVSTTAAPAATRDPEDARPSPTLPSCGGPTELPAPTGTLKHVTVGRGVQNYTCSATGAVPVAIGAVATLYDFTHLAHKHEAALHTAPSILVNIPIASANGSSIRLDVLGPFDIIGRHFFLANGTPTFDLFEDKEILFCKKIANVSAPATASVGSDGTGAVPWLALSDKGGSVGLSEVYRVETAGGKAPATCPDANPISIQYAAEYWFYD